MPIPTFLKAVDVAWDRFDWETVVSADAVEMHRNKVHSANTDRKGRRNVRAASFLSGCAG